VRRRGGGVMEGEGHGCMALLVVVEPTASVGQRLKMTMSYGSHTSVTVEGRKGSGWRK
jgi:hypothetical protein